MSFELPPCLECGACCYSRSARYVTLEPRDHATLVAHHLDHLARPDGKYMRMEKGHCAALEPRGGKHVCTIYEHRPSVCRRVKRLSSPCLVSITERRQP